MCEAVRVLVTGGAGFIGSHVVDRLVSEGYGVRVIDDLSTGKLENIAGHLGRGRVEFVKGDVRDVSVVRKFVDDVDVVVHLAAVTSVPFSFRHPNLTYDVNVWGTWSLLRACAEEKIDRFVFVSSCAVYGEPEFLPVDEKHPANPISFYAASKLAAERYCLALSGDEFFGSVVLRLFNVYGRRQGVNDYCGVITRFIDCCRRRVPLVVYGDGSQTRDFVNVRDVVEAVLAAVQNEDVEGEVFNVGSGRPTSVDELAKTVLDLAGVNLKICYEEPRVGDVKQSYADVSKAEKFLGYKPEVTLRDGLRTLLTYKNLVAR